MEHRISRYYYIDNRNQQCGPVPASMLKSYGVTLDSYVWKAGMQNWAKAKTIPELQTILCSTSQQQRVNYSQNPTVNYNNPRSNKHLTTISQQRIRPSNGLFTNLAKQYLRSIVVAACTVGSAYCFSMWTMHDLNASHAEYAVGGVILSISGFVFYKLGHKILEYLGL